MQAVLFEIQLIRSKSAQSSAKHDNANPNYSESETSVKNGHQEDNHLFALDTNNMSRRGSHGVKSILLKGEMRFVQEINMLVFLCSPLLVYNLITYYNF